MELNAKLEAAWVAYLNQYVDGDITTIPPNTDIPSTFYWPTSLQRDDKTYRIFAGESDGNKDGQAILCIAGDSTDEEPPHTGNKMVPFQIWLRTPVRTLTPDEISKNVTSAIGTHKAAATMLENAIMQDPFLLAGYLTDSADDLTVYGPVMDRLPMREDVTNYYASGWSMKLYAMGMSA